jgi:hypothetical protein
VRHLQLTGLAAAIPTEDANEVAVPGELDDTGIHITVGHIEVAAWRDRHVIGLVEPIARRVVARNPFGAQRHETFAVGAELVDGMTDRVGDAPFIVRIALPTDG